MKLLLENWRQYVNEEITGTGTAKLAGSPKEQMEEDERRWYEFTESLGYEVAGKLGEGAMGDVYLVKDKKGSPHAMKVVTKALYGGPRSAKREYENYKFAMDQKKFIPEKYAKYIPDVDNVVEGDKDYFFFMELLEPLPERVKTDLFALSYEDEDLDREEKYKRILRDPSAIWILIKTAIAHSGFLRQIDDEELIQNNNQIANAALSRVLDIPSDSLGVAGIATAAMAAIIDHITKHQDESKYYELVKTVLKTKHWDIKDYLESDIREQLKYLLNKQIVPVDIALGQEMGAGSSAEEVVQNFPEAAGLIDAMKYLYDHENWTARDVHSGNVMKRPGTDNFVITDLGLFKFREQK